jgi:MFS family permease
MALGTCLVGLMPTYASIGVAAPILLAVLRFLQGIGLGGEWGGAALLIVEHAPTRRRGFFGSIPGMGIPGGLLLASAVFALVNTMPDAEFLSWGWRVPFVSSVVLLLVGIFIRLRVAESPVFRRAREARTPDQERVSPLGALMRTEKRFVAIAAGGRFAGDVSFYISSTFLIAYVSGPLLLGRALGLRAQLVGAAVELVMIPVFGLLTDRVGRRPVYLLGFGLAALVAVTMFPMLATKSAAAVITVAVLGIGITNAANTAPQCSFYAELFGTGLRYTGASLGYQLSSPLAGGLAPLIATGLLAWANGATWPVVLYMLVICAISATAVLLAPETRGREIDAAEPAAETLSRT